MIIVMQGRLRSTRLPGKGFFTFFGQTIWERMCDIALGVDGVDEVIFATGGGEENELMRPLIEAKGVRFYAGSEENVLERYVGAIQGYMGEYLVRLTCDNYLAQPEIIEEMYASAKSKDVDYAYIAPLSHYAGEIVRCNALRDCLVSDYSKEAKEHVTWDIRHSNDLSILELAPDFLDVDHSVTVTLDDIDDLILMKRLELTCDALKNVRCTAALRDIATLVGHSD